MIRLRGELTCQMGKENTVKQNQGEEPRQENERGKEMQDALPSTCTVTSSSFWGVEPKLSWSQTPNMNPNADSEEAFLTPRHVSEEIFFFFENHLTQESKEVLNTTLVRGILPCRKAQIKSQYEMENWSHSQMCHIFSCRKPVLEVLWVMEGLCSIAEHKPLDITCAQKQLWALPVKLLSYCIIHICFMMTQCLPCWIFYFSSSKTINYSPWQEMFSLPLF